jgi:hypothetical protein
MRWYLVLIAMCAAGPVAGQVTAAGVNPDTMPAPKFSEQAIAMLAAEYAARPHQEFLGCMLGWVRGDTVLVQRVVLAKGQTGDSNSVSLPFDRGCTNDFDNVIGHIHSHTKAELVKGDQCSYYHLVDGHQRWLQDLTNFRYGPHGYVADAIYCGDRITWLDVGYRERVLHRTTKLSIK